MKIRVANGPFNEAIPNKATLEGEIVDVDGFDDRTYTRLPQGINGSSTQDYIRPDVWNTECGNIAHRTIRLTFVR
ncbi:MAG: hypothetical protein R3B47_07280 [Bacteroidia bacterium]